MHIDVHVTRYSYDSQKSIKSFFIIINQEDFNNLVLKGVKKHWMYTCMVNNHCLIIQVKIYGVPFVPLHLYVKNKLSIFWASISKSNFDFGMELRFRNEALISKSSFDFKMGLQFRNGASILKWSFDFEMELRFQNRASISKWCFDFEMENGTVVLKSKTLLICLQVTT